MTRAIALIAVVLTATALCPRTSAQEKSAPPMVAAEQSPAAKPETQRPVAEAVDKLDDVVSEVDRSPQAQDVKTNILAPIYSLAEAFSFPAFYWLAFAAMVTGVVSFALQLVLGKLVALSKFSMSPSEILSDALGLLISLIGLVLTTQAATENSTFTSSAFAVLSASIVGALLGIVFYVWGQRQELQAVEGRRLHSARTHAGNEESHS
jgi:hypothetical protein